MFFCVFFVTMGELMSSPARFPSAVLVVIILLLFVVNAVAEYRHLYFFIWWLDIPMHILGGGWVALFGLTTYYASLRFKEKDYSTAFVVSLAVALALSIGLAWEIFEFGVGHAVGDSGAGLLDTLKDLSDDFLGALLAASIFIRGGYNKRT